VTNGARLSAEAPVRYEPPVKLEVPIEVAMQWQPAAGALAELALPEEGMAGSWYPVEVLEVNESNEVLVLIGALLGEEILSAAGTAREDDFSAHANQLPHLSPTEPRHMAAREWHPSSRLRPRPPQTQVTFQESLQPGCMVEIWYEGGWWQVIVRRTPNATLEDCCGDGESAALARAPAEADAASQQPWELESVHFANSHCELQPLLRPCWRWQPGKRVDRCWSISDKPPMRYAPKRPPKRKGTELTPGNREKEQEENSRILKELLEQQFAVGQIVEVRGSEEGFLGSWYAARVVEAREARSTIRLRLCYQAFKEDDGSTWEDWVELSQVRPLPPAHNPSFLRGLKAGAALELNFEEGWWDVEYKGSTGPKHTVMAKRYKVRHSVPASQLRPAWRWSATSREWQANLSDQPAETGSSRAASATQRARPPKKDPKNQSAAADGKVEATPAAAAAVAGSASNPSELGRCPKHPGLCRLLDAAGQVTSQKPQGPSSKAARTANDAADTASQPPSSGRTGRGSKGDGSVSPDSRAQGALEEPPVALQPPIERAREYGVGHTRRGVDGQLYKVIPGSTPTSFEWTLLLDLHVGQRVLAHYGKDEDELWWPGTVLTAHRSGHADVRYDDGDIECKKPSSRLRPLT